MRPPLAGDAGSVEPDDEGVAADLRLPPAGVREASVAGTSAGESSAAGVAAEVRPPPGAGVSVAAEGAAGLGAIGPVECSVVKSSSQTLTHPSYALPAFPSNTSPHLLHHAPHNPPPKRSLRRSDQHPCRATRPPAQLPFRRLQNLHTCDRGLGSKVLCLNIRAGPGPDYGQDFGSDQELR